MSISLIDLPYLIELVSKDIKNLEEAINNPDTSEEIRNVSGELLIIAFRTAANLNLNTSKNGKQVITFPAMKT